MSLGMERALTFSYVKQLPRTTLEEVKQQEGVYDRQVLLNEPWVNYCHRIGRADKIPEEPQRDKWETETWDEWEERKHAQPGLIDAFFSDLKRKEMIEAAARQKKDEKSAKILEEIARSEKERKKKLLPVLHTLLLDFEEKRKQEDLEVRMELEAEEEQARQVVVDDAQVERKVLGELWAKGIIDIEEELKRQKEEEEEAQHLKEEQEKRLEQERLEREEKELEETKRQEDERTEQEKKRVQQEKDRKAAERKARVMAERDKRKSKEELAASRRDSRRRSSAKVNQVSIKDQRRDEAHVVRLRRQAAEMEDYLHKLQPRVEKCTSEELLGELMRDVALELGLLLFDTAVYIVLLEGAALCFRYASQNCSNLLIAGQENFHVAEHPDAPTVLAIKYKETVHLQNPVKNNEEGLVRVGTKEDGGAGDFFTTPIFNASGEVAAMLSADTLVELNKQQTNFEENEEDCYTFDTTLPALPITPEVAAFLEAVAKLLSQAHITGQTPSVKECGSMPDLFAKVTKAISDFGPGINCYLATLTRPLGDTLTVVAQNGYVAGQEAPENFGPHNNVLAKTLSDKEAPSFNLKPAEGIYEYVENVKNTDGVKGYASEEKRNNYLYLFPVLVNYKGGMVVISVVGVEGDAQYPLKEAQIQQIQELLAQLGERRSPLLKMRMRRMYALQCVQWCSALSGCSHVYMSFKRRVVREMDSDDMEYVAATLLQKWVLGMVLPEGEGVTPVVMEGGTVRHYQDVTKEPAVKLLGGENVAKGGQLVAAPIGDVGMLYMDTVNWSQGKRNFTDADLSMVTSAASLLTSLLTEVDEGNVDEVGADEPRLKIEDDVSPSCVRFLKKVWLHSMSALHSMKKEELLEMARYNKPPEAIPPVCGATFIVMGKKPSVVSTWDKTRKCIKYTVLKKMSEFDPTAGKPSKSFFIRAKKMTKGLTVDFVAKKGSKPTSLFFHWTYASIQLRYAAVSIRKLNGSGMLDLADDLLPEEKEGTVTDLNSSAGETITTEGDKDLEDDEDEGEGEGDEEASNGDD